MKITTLSKDKLESEFGNCENLGHVLLSLENHFQEDGEVICEIKVNGLVLSEADEKTHAGTLVADIQEMSVGTETPERLIASTIESMLNLFPQVKKASLSSSDLFRHGGDVEKQVGFAKVLEGSQWISDALFLIKQNIFEIVKVELFRKQWGGLEAKFGSIVKEILKSFEKKDFILLADLLEYELPSLLDGWEQLIISEFGRLQKHFNIPVNYRDNKGIDLESDNDFSRNIDC